MTIREGGAIHGTGLLNPIPLVVPVIVSVLDTDPRRPSVGERRGLSFNASIPVIVLSDSRGVVRGLVVRGREHLASTRYKLVEWGQAHPDFLGVGRRWS